MRELPKQKGGKVEIHVTLKWKDTEIHYYDEYSNASFTIPREQLDKLIKDLGNIKALLELGEKNG